MKKYRLIEYNIHNQKGELLKAKYNSVEQAADTLITLQAYHTQSYYRIEEVEKSIMERVKSYEDACEVLGIKPITTAELVVYNKGEREYADDIPNHIIALLKLETITAALNEGWKPDLKNPEQEKYYVSIDLNRCVNVSCHRETFNVPSRLYFKSRELAEYAAKQFKELYEQLLIEKF